MVSKNSMKKWISVAMCAVVMGAVMNTAVAKDSKHKDEKDKIEKATFGRYEKVQIKELDKATTPAKLDTGAYTSSLHAENVKVKKKDGDDWVRFYTRLDGKKMGPYEFPVERISKVKKRLHSEDSKAALTRRPVILLTFCLGDRAKKVEVNLADRSNLNYPLLIGTKALRPLKAVVDVSKQYMHSPKCDK